MSELKKKKPLWFKLCMIFLSILLFFALIIVVVRAYFRLPVSEYYKNSEKAFVIPELSKGFIAQGLDFDERTGSFFVTGYMNDGSASPVCIIDKETGKNTKNLKLKNIDGTDFNGHAGGIKLHDDYIYIAGSSEACLFVFSYSDALSAKDGDYITCIGTFDSYPDKEQGLNVAFVSEYEGKLVIGEFYRDPNYQTPSSHKITTSAGDYNQAVAVVFEYSDEGNYGISEQPVMAFSMPDLVQGMYTYDGHIYLSTSYAVAFSHFYVYDTQKMKEQGNITLFGKDVPLYALDSESIVNDIKLAPMSEEIVIVDGKLYTMCESASNKYIFGKFTSGKWCYATDLSKYK